MFCDEESIFCLRFDRTSRPPTQAEFSCRDFKKDLTSRFSAYYVQTDGVTPDAERMIDIFEFLNRCAAFARRLCVDTEILRRKNGYRICFSFEGAILEGETLYTLGALMKQCDKCMFEIKDIAQTPIDEPTCLVHLFIYTHVPYAAD